MKQILISALALFAFSGCAQLHGNLTREVVVEQVSYSTEKTELKGYLYKPANKKSRGGVLVVHEWYGLNEYARSRAMQLAELGYTTLAIDMYGNGKVADHPKEANAFMTESMKDQNEIREKFKAGMKTLVELGEVDPDKIAALGYCFGGGISLQMARAGLNLAAVASFHGALGTTTPAKNGVIKGKILVGNGGADPMVPASDVASFTKEMHEAGVDFELLNFKGALHSFTVKSADEVAKKYKMPVGYDREADERSWNALLELLDSKIL